MRRLWNCQQGQQTIEYALVYAGVVLPITCAIIFTAQVLWVWHSVVEFARDGAHYAATHCWQASGDNVREYMRTHTPFTVDREQFQSGGDELIVIQYSAMDAESGTLVEFACESGECTRMCIPDVVTVRIQGYEYRHPFLSQLGIAPITIPDFRTTVPMESAGCDPETTECLP